MAEIPLTQGYVAIVDDADLDWLLQRKWRAMVGKPGRLRGPRVYAVTGPGSGLRLFMHRLICPPPAGCVVDHISGDTLDNRRINLRSATPRENHQSQRHPPSASGYRGVKARPSGRFYAQIMVLGRPMRLGTVDTAEEAARLYDDAARHHFGAFAVLNFPEEAGPCR